MSIRLRLRDIVESTETRAGRAFDWLVVGLILVSLATFSIDTIPDLPAAVHAVLRVTEVIIVVLFLLEYLLRIWIAERRLGYIFSFYGLIDLVAFLPSLIALGVDLRSLRSFRLVRVFRLLKLARYTHALDRFRAAMRRSREELLLFSFLAMVLMWVSAVGVYYFEHDAQPDKFASIFHSLWWAIATLTTVGYGDIAPVTAGGRFFTAVTLIIGLSVVAVPAGILSSALTDDRRRARRDDAERSE